MDFQTRLASPKLGSNWVEIIEMNHAGCLVPVKYVQLTKKQHQQTTRLYPANHVSASHRPLIYQIPTMSGPILLGNPILPCLSCMPLWPPQNVWLELWLYKWVVFDDFFIKIPETPKAFSERPRFWFNAAPVIFLPRFLSCIYLIPNPPKRRLKPHYLEDHPS